MVRDAVPLGDCGRALVVKLRHHGDVLLAAPVLSVLKARAPQLEVDGEMQADTALSPNIRERLLPGSTLTGRANLFVMPNLDAANIAYNLVRAMTDGVALGPILMGVAKPAHVLTPAATVRRVVNMTALAAVEAQIRSDRKA